MPDSVIPWRRDFENMPAIVCVDDDERKGKPFLAYVKYRGPVILYRSQVARYSFEDLNALKEAHETYNGRREAGVMKVEYWDEDRDCGWVSFWYDAQSRSIDGEYGGDGDSATDPDDIIAWCHIDVPSISLVMGL